MRTTVRKALPFVLPCLVLAVTAVPLPSGCSSKDAEPVDYGTNPFIEDQSLGKEDTGYINLAGTELHVTIEADIDAPSYTIFDSPPYLSQFAVTYLRKRHEFYLELINEDTTVPDRVEWLVDGVWLTAQEARSVEEAKLTHFRLQNINAVVLNRTAEGISAGQVMTARVPRKPYSIYADAGDSCADYNSHISLGQSVYWYLWNPDRSGCRADLQDMTVTVAEVLPANPPSYPEYDRLWEDGRLDAVVVFGKLDDGDDIEDDYNWNNADRFVTWLREGGFTEQTDAPLGRRFSKTAGDRTEVVDVYYPNLFHGLTDYANFPNWQRAVSEHEVVVYLGHSTLGTGFAYERVEYPSFYQIFVIGGCLGYEYYVRPVLAGKGGWENVDAISSIVENYYHELNMITGAFLAKLFYGFEHEGRADWQEIMTAINTKLGHAHFGVSGGRGNCFTPEGSQCGQSYTYENTTAAAIPDNNPDGVMSTLTVPDSVVIGSLGVELDVTHTYVGDLEIILSHGDVDHVLWNRAGGSEDNIQETFHPETFGGMDASGEWSLRLVDHASQDEGTLNRWVITVTPQG
jgi:hypothetical protein